MAAPGEIQTTTPQTVTGGQSGVVIDGSTINPNTNQPVGVEVLGPVTFDSSISVTGNIYADYIVGNITANISNALHAVTANTVVDNAQPNITSVGTLTTLSVTGNAGVGAILTDNILFANGQPYTFTANANVAGSNTQVQFNTSGNFDASAAFTFNKTTNTLSVTNITSNGAGLSSLTGANVTGIVANAAYSAYADFAGTAMSANSVTGANVSGQVANALVAGTVYTAAQPNITSVGALTSLALNGPVTSNVSPNPTAFYSLGNTANVWKDVWLSNAVQINGQSITANASSIIFSAPIAGSVEQANYANIANSVSGSNVSGPVAYATTANSVSGSNVSGPVAYATTANSVSGSNVSGPVAFATTANSVAGGNVSGAVALATLANTVNDAAQPNITSVGTLSSLSVSGNAKFGPYAALYPNASFVLGTQGNTGSFGTIRMVTAGNVAYIQSGANTDSNSAADLKFTTIGAQRTWMTLTANGNLGINNTSPQETLVVNGAANITGNVTGSYFLGNGALLTGIATGSSSNISNGTSNVSIPVASGNITASVNAISALTLSNSSVAVGNSASAKANSVAIGNSAVASVSGVAIGYGAIANTSSIAIGEGVGSLGANPYTIAIGYGAGLQNQGTNSIVIGTGAGWLNQANNSIFLNATGNYLASGAANTFSVLPVRKNLTSNLMYYDSSTGEVTYDVLSNLVIATANTVTDNAQPNITSVGTLSSLSVSGNVVTSGNLTVQSPGLAYLYGGLSTIDVATATLSATGNVRTSGNLTVAGLATLTGGATGGNITSTTLSSTGNIRASNNLVVVANANIGNIGTAGILTVTGNANVGNLGTAGLITATGNVTANYFLGNGSQLTGVTATSIVSGNSNVNIAAANGNVTVGVAGNANITTFTGSSVVIGTGTGGNISSANVITGNTVKTTSTTFASLPTASVVGAGARGFITDANTTTFASQVAGGGSNAVPVYTNGTNWYVG